MRRIILTGFWILIAVMGSFVDSAFISAWFPIAAQTISPVIIPHPLNQIPVKVEVQVKVQESGNEIIFPASGSMHRDDDSDNIYGGVVYLYNELHVKIFVPLRDENSYKGVIIYTGGTAFAGPFQANYVQGEVRVIVWGLCDLPPANFTLSGGTSISGTDNHKTITHGLGKYPDLVVVQLKMTNGYISEAGGVTFNSVSESYQSICGTVFAFNDQNIRLWSISGSGNYVACARDGWGSEELQSSSADLFIQAWILDSCNKHFSSSFALDKNNVDPASPTVDRVTLDSVYSLNTTLVSVQMKVFTSNNAGYVFYAGGSAMIDESTDPFGAIIYGYTETEVLLWRPDIASTNGYLVYVGGQWGAGNNNQQDNSVEVTVKVLELTGSPCTGTNECSADWTTLQTICTPTDCPDPPDLANAYKVYNGVSNGSTAMYSCMPGYAQSSHDVIITCTDGYWSSSTMFCEAICAAPPSIPNADVQVFDFMAIYSCQEGYLSQTGSSLINCSQSVWQTTTFSCTASCGPAPNITGADVLVNGDVAMYACHYGFSATNAGNEINCVSGTWPSTTFQCIDSSNNGVSRINNQTLNEWIARIRRELIINRKRTNAYLRSLTSVYDPRPSAIAIGSSGVFIFSFAFLLIMIPDIITVIRYIRERYFPKGKSDD